MDQARLARLRRSARGDVGGPTASAGAAVASGPDVMAAMFGEADFDPGSNTGIQRTLRRSGGLPGSDATAPDRAASIPSGGGVALPEEHRRGFEQALGHPFDHVRIHTDAGSDRAARDMGALAFAVGADVYFRAGVFAPGTPEGDRVLGHELVHVVQGDKGRIHAAGADEPEVSSPTDPLEREAYGSEDAIAHRAAEARELWQLGGPAVTPDWGIAAQSYLGNRAVSRVVHRDAGGAGRTDQQLDDLTKAFDDDDAARALQIIAGLSGGQAATVLLGYQAMAVSTFGNDEMFVAVGHLVSKGGRLARGLEWMYDEGTNFSYVTEVIGRCSNAGHLAECRTDAWKERFISEYGNDEIDQLVDLLQGDLPWKLIWMHGEGTSVAAVGRKAGGRGPELYPNPVMKELFMREYSSPSDMEEIFGVLGGTIQGQALWMTPSADWVSRLLKRSTPTDVLVVCGADAAWGPFVKAKIGDVLAKLPTPIPDDCVQGLWNAYDDGAGISAEDAELLFKKLYNVPIVAAGTPIVLMGEGESIDSYTVVGPSPGSMVKLLQMLKPLPRGHVAAATGGIAFCSTVTNQKKDADGKWVDGKTTPLPTSYFSSGKGYIIFKSDAGGGTDDTPVDDGEAYHGGDARTYFQNHARHEVGHAVGARFGGDGYAEKWGGWRKATAADVEATMWSPGPASVRLDMGNGPVDVTDGDAKVWVSGALAGTNAPGPIGDGSKKGPEKLQLLKANGWGGQKVFQYMDYLGPNRSNADRGYEWPGLIGMSPVVMWCTRWGGGLAAYKGEALSALQPKLGWYSCSSPAEMFAEIYCAKYTEGWVPDGGWGGFFADLESKQDPMFQNP